MENRTRYLLLGSEVMICFIFALTAPFVQLHFIKLVSPSVYTVSMLMSTTLCALTQTVLQTKERRAIFRKYLMLIMVLDVILMIGVNYIGIYNISIRFLGATFMNSITSVIWFTIMREVINDTLSSEKLTNFQVLSQSFQSWATATGGAFAVVLSYLHIEWIIVAIVLQCLANLVYAICDYNAYKQLLIGKKG